MSCPLRCLAARFGPALSALMALALTACAAQIPQDRRGVSDFEIEGAERLDPDAIQACLATRERDRFGFEIGGDAEPICGEPPFDGDRIPVELWAWPWADWPLFDPAIFERDQERIERWYQARGYYEARVEQATVDELEDRRVALKVRVSEGQPSLVETIDIHVTGDEAEQLEPQLRSVLTFGPGDPFDEYRYDESKEALRRALGEAAYAHATVEGHVRIEPASHTAYVEFAVVPGERCHFGQVFVQGQEELSGDVIAAAAGIEPNSPFSLSALDDARQAVYALGPFASVEVAPLVEPEARTVHVLVKVVRGRETRFRIGAGMESGGNLYTQQAEGSFAQWDIHLLARYEHRNFLGGMRRLQIEERPRLIFDGRFPDTSAPNLGNALGIDFRQPAFIEARTSLISTLRWDLGPDPFGGRFFRSDFNLGVGPERRFFGGALKVTSTVNWHQFRELPGIFQDLAGLQESPYPDYDVFFMSHHAQLELRDNPRSPRRGVFAQVGVIHAGYFLPGDFNYVRLTPDLRGYLPLPFGIVLAARARLGLMHISSSDIAVPPADSLSGLADQGFVQRLRRFGPLRHRLRGGGHNSVRGYRPNELGDVVLINGRLDSGGLRQWETSVELRLPITQNFGTVFFVDAGDVNREARFRFDHPQTTLGIGLRYDTLVGPLRLDAGFAPPDLQVFGRDERIRAGLSQSQVFGLGAGAVHFTIGEAF